jgi:hypothetical protein
MDLTLQQNRSLQIHSRTEKDGEGGSSKCRASLVSFRSRPFVEPRGGELTMLNRGAFGSRRCRDTSYERALLGYVEKEVDVKRKTRLFPCCSRCPPEPSASSPPSLTTMSIPRRALQRCLSTRPSILAARPIRSPPSAFLPLLRSVSDAAPNPSTPSVPVVPVTGATSGKVEVRASGKKAGWSHPPRLNVPETRRPLPNIEVSRLFAPFLGW